MKVSKEVAGVSQVGCNGSSMVTCVRVVVVRYRTRGEQFGSQEGGLVPRAGEGDVVSTFW